MIKNGCASDKLLLSRKTIIVGVLALIFLLMIFFRKKILVVIFAILTFLLTCTFFDEKVISRVPSPNGKVDAICVRLHAGASKGTSDTVYIIPSNEKWGPYLGNKEVSTAISIKYATNVKIFWLSNNCLMVQYGSGTSDIFNPSIICRGEKIEIRTSRIGVPET